MGVVRGGGQGMGYWWWVEMGRVIRGKERRKRERVRRKGREIGEEEVT